MANWDFTLPDQKSLDDMRTTAVWPMESLQLELSEPCRYGVSAGRQ